MILLRSVIFLALAGAGIWYFLAEPDRRAASDAIEQELTAEAEMLREALTKDLRTLELAVALVARSAPVAALLAEKPEPASQRPAAEDTFDGNGFARPALPPVAIPDERTEEQALQDLKSLETLTGLTALGILKRGETETLPLLKPPSALLTDGRWEANIDAAFQGQPEQTAFMGDDGDPSFLLFAPYFGEGDAPAIVIAEARLSDAKSQWSASEHQLSLTGADGAVILTNSVDAGAEAIKVSREIPAIDAVITVGAAKPAFLGPWAIRSGVAFGVAILLLLLWELNLSRRRLRSEAAGARGAGDTRPEEVILERKAALDKSTAKNASAESLALLAQVSDSIGQEINRPLSAIRHHAEAAHRSVDQGKMDGARENIRQVSNLADRITRIVANMRGFVTSQPYQIEPVSIRPVVHDAAVHMLERDPALGDFFFMEVADDVSEKAFVRADKTRLSQVIDSLLSSSWDACRDQEQPELVISIQQTRGNMVVAIDHSGRPDGMRGPDGRRISVGEVAESSGPVAKSASYTIAKSIVEGMGGKLINKASALGGDRIEIVMPKFRPNAA